MDISAFSDQKSGKLVEISGAKDITHAFVPELLPPDWKIPSGLWPLIVEANRAIGSLDGIGKHMTNPRLFIRPLQHREAQLSSRLEGTITIPRQQLLFDLEQKKSGAGEERDAYREVSNYKKALQNFTELEKEIPLSLRTIREIHKTLLTGVRGGQKKPGNFRDLPVQVGRPSRYVPPPPQLMDDLLYNLEDYFHKPITNDPLVDTFITHYQLEAIHPFFDGNGRVGRLLMAFMISRCCNLSRNWLYMSAYFDENKDEYLDRLFAVSTHSQWTEWITFCLKGVLTQAADTESRCSNLIALSNEYKRTVEGIGGSYRLHGIIDELFDLPVITIPIVEKRFDISYPTAKSDIESLVDANILYEIPDERPRTFYCSDIINTIFE